MEAILSIVGLALSVASLIPAFTSKHQQQKILFTAIAFSVVGIFLFQIWNIQAHQEKVKVVQDEIIEKLSASGSMTFEQLLNELYYADFSTANEAIDNLVEAGNVKQNLVDINLPSGKRSKVRIYHQATF
jgi:Tfp pilus assembly ATPase PilU